MNIVGCVMLGALVLSMPSRPDVEKLTVYYRQSMMTAPMKRFCRMSGKRKIYAKRHQWHEEKLLLSVPWTANPYCGTWSIYLMPMTADTKQGSRNGICTWMVELGLF